MSFLSVHNFLEFPDLFSQIYNCLELQAKLCYWSSLFLQLRLSLFKSFCNFGVQVSGTLRISHGFPLIYNWLLTQSNICLVCLQLMSLSDLEFDFINPYDSSSRVNMVVIPEFAIQGDLCLLFIFNGHWFMFLCSAPIMYYHVQL